MPTAALDLFASSSARSPVVPPGEGLRGVRRTHAPDATDLVARICEEAPAPREAASDELPERVRSTRRVRGSR